MNLVDVVALSVLAALVGAAIAWRVRSRRDIEAWLGAAMADQDPAVRRAAVRVTAARGVEKHARILLARSRFENDSSVLDEIASSALRYGPHWPSSPKNSAHGQRVQAQVTSSKPGGLFQLMAWAANRQSLRFADSAPVAPAPVHPMEPAGISQHPSWASNSDPIRSVDTSEPVRTDQHASASSVPIPAQIAWEPRGQDTEPTIDQPWPSDAAPGSLSATGSKPTIEDTRESSSSSSVDEASARSKEPGPAPPLQGDSTPSSSTSLPTGTFALPKTIRRAPSRRQSVDKPLVRRADSVIVVGQATPAALAMMRSLGAAGCSAILAEPGTCGASAHFAAPPPTHLQPPPPRTLRDRRREATRLRADHFLPDPHHPEFLVELVSLAQSRGAGAILCVDTDVLEAISQARRVLEDHAIASWAPDLGVLAVCEDRSVYASIASSAGVRVAKTGDDLNPGSRRFVAELLVERNGLAAGCVTLWKEEVDGSGALARGETFHSKSVRSAAIRAVGAIGLRGPCSVEGIADDWGDVAIETLSPVFSDALALACAVGSDLVGQYLNAVIGRRVDPARMGYEAGLVVTRHGDDLVSVTNHFGTIPAPTSANETPALRLTSQPAASGHSSGPNRVDLHP